MVFSVLDPLRLSDSGHRWTFRVDTAGPIWIYGDAGRLEEVVSNLLANAQKYSPLGKEIEVAVGVHGGRARLTIRDQGQGIPPKDLSRVFERFARAGNWNGRDPGGIGLGLFISRQIVLRHGGHLWVRSEEGPGTIFTVDLPIARGFPIAT